MQYGIVSGERLEAAPGLRGECPFCGKPVLARCGQLRVWHWAHKGKQSCDPWAKAETPWHRAWKAEFPADWQEVIHNRVGEGNRHIADVKTPHGLVLEFQHSHLSLAEQREREAFYGNMVWVVDGTRNKGALSTFLRWKWSFRPTHLDGILASDVAERCFPAAWVGSSVIVVFDFAGAENASPDDELWCLLPGRVRRNALAAPLPRRELVRMAHEQSFVYETSGIMVLVEDHFQKEEAQWFGYPPAHLRRTTVL